MWRCAVKDLRSVIVFCMVCLLPMPVLGDLQKNLETLLRYGSQRSIVKNLAKCAALFERLGKDRQALA